MCGFPFMSTSLHFARSNKLFGTDLMFPGLMSAVGYQKSVFGSSIKVANFVP